MPKTKLNKDENKDILQIFRSELYERIGVKELLRNKSVLDVGCGDGEDALNLSQYAKNVVGIDINTSTEWKKSSGKKIRFVKSKAEKLPFKANTFNGLFLKDVIHHVNDINISLTEIKRVTTSNATLIIVEGNRFNPLFYFYATKIYNHQHLTQKRFEFIIKKFFPNARFKYIECYPPFLLKNIALYKFALLIQKMVNKVSVLKPFFSYNVAIIKE